MLIKSFKLRRLDFVILYHLLGIFIFITHHTFGSNFLQPKLDGGTTITIYIPDDYPTIQDGIDASLEGDAVIVKPGIYSQEVNFRGKNIILRSTDPTSPSIVANTQLVDFGVTFSGEEGTTCVLAGFTIRDHDHYYEAGVIGNGTRATIKNNIIRDNRATGIPWELDDCHSGISQCDGLIEGNVICNNSSLAGGSGISDCQGIIRRNLIEQNIAYFWVTFHEEETGQDITIYYGHGAGIYLCHGVMVNNIIRNNECAFGAGVYECNGKIENNLIHCNKIKEDCNGLAGLIYCKAAIKNNVIFNNASTTFDASLVNCTGPIENNIIWWNSRYWKNGSQLMDCSVPKYCCIEDWTGGGEDNISSTPLFNDVGKLSFTLDDSSPCIDSGSPDEKDNDGCLPQGKGSIRNDIGAYGGPENCGWDVFLISTPTPLPTQTPFPTPTPIPTQTPTPVPTQTPHPTPTPLPPRIIYVPDQTGTIQEAIDVSCNGDIVLVSPGLYVENLDFKGKNITLRSLDPKSTETVTATIIDGNDSAPVITFSGMETESCVLSGFTIKNGWADYDQGGGITGNSTKATIQYNIITQNYHDEYLYPEEIREMGAGGIWNCDGIIRYNRIIDNDCSYYSVGGMNECDGIIYGNLISENGCGIFNSGALIFNNSILDGIGNCHGFIFNCIFTIASYQDGNKVNYKNCLVITNNPITSFEKDNLQGDPLFINPQKQDYRLRADSPGRDAGNTFLLYLKDHLTDINGNCRISGNAVDLGCFEYGSTSDLDGDLLSDIQEDIFGTDPLDIDSDNDGLQDGIEVLRNTNPMVYNHPQGIIIPDDFNTIQEGIFLAFPHETIEVQAQTYWENLLISGKDINLKSMDPSDEDIVTSTIIDGGYSSSVVHFTGCETNRCAISGFTIEHGSSLVGGGIWGNGTHASILNNRIMENRVNPKKYYYYEGHGDPYVSYYLGSGGGLWKCHGPIENNIISHNTAHEGGGLYDCDGLIRGNQILDNQSLAETWLGGGGLVYCDNAITDNLIANNISLSSGGGIMKCNGPVINNRICGNKAGTDGGGLSSLPGFIANNIIWNNEAGNGGGIHGCGGMIANCTIWGNTAKVSGGGIFSCWSSQFINCILWNNKDYSNRQFETGYVPALQYSCVQNWPWMDDNVTTDPNFVSPETGDFHLQASSPCIDAGNPAPEWNDAFLPPGMGSERCDMGAYGGPFNSGLVAAPMDIVDHILGKKDLTPEQKSYVDQNGNGIVDIGDLIYLMKCLY